MGVILPWPRRLSGEDRVMARGSSKIQAMALYDNPYENFSAMPWEAIEKAAGESFGEEARQEIFACFKEGISTEAMQNQAPSKREFEEVRDKLRRLARNLVEFNENYSGGYDGPAGIDVPARNDQIFRAISLAYSERASVTDECRSMARSAEVILQCLEQEPSISLDPNAAEPQTVGLAAFISSALIGAEAFQARGGKHWDAKGLEFRSWGISLGPQSAQFRKFLSAVFSNIVSEKQLENSWKHMRENLNSLHPHFDKLAR